MKLVVAILAWWGGVAHAEAPTVLAPGYGALAFTAPTPGTYELPPLGPAADGRVLNHRGQPFNLHALYGDKIVLLSFIYASCSEVHGCPLATTVLHRIKRRLLKEPAKVANNLRLLTLSFDPEHDTPAVMAKYGQHLRNEKIDWHFLTTAKEQEVQPILRAYDQTVQKRYNEAGRPTGAFSHTLRVYLIDRNKQLRNIYSVNFLHPEILMNDVKTLLLEEH